MKNLHWVILAPVILFAIVVSVRFLACGPDRKVVRVAKPVAKIIADDIVKNGIPKSLKDIKGLPYVLEGCVYKYQKNKVEEKCYFLTSKGKYNVYMWFGESITEYGKMKISKNYTYVAVSFDLRNDTIYRNDIYSRAKHHGVLCSAFKQ
jgi:hypothetical protein